MAVAVADIYSGVFASEYVVNLWYENNLTQHDFRTVTNSGRTLT